MVVIGHKLTSVDHLETRSSPLALMTGSALADIRSFTSAFAASGSLAVAINFALIPARYFAPQALGIANPGLFDYLPFFSNMFLHGGWLHLILNMWTLWVFGPAIEDRLGRGRYLAFYLGCGVLASVTHAAFNPTSLAPALGVSGAIAGVLGCYLRLFPYSRVIVLVPILFVPLFFDLYAVVFIGIWIAVQVLQGVTELVTPATGEGIAWWAHIGGFAGGLVFGGLLKAPASRYRAYYGDEGVLGFTPGGMR
ncbi:MAG: rhomboid family intramembrane serine protease [Terriglobia bacterium]